MDKLKDHKKIKKESQFCPECGSVLEVNKGYTTWCDKCNWNLQNDDEKVTIPLFERIYQKFASKYSKKLYEEIASERELKPKINLNFIIANMLSLIVLGFNILFVFCGIFVFFIGLMKFLAVFLALIFWGLAYLSRPQFVKMKGDILPVHEFPTLYKVVNEIAESVGLKKVDGILIDEKFNASYTNCGIKKKHYITIGLPLFSILDDKEKVALLAHEAAHGVNGDLGRERIISAAMNTLKLWHDLLKGNIFYLGLAKLIYFIYYVLLNLYWKESQRAEYIADYKATILGSSESITQMLDKSQYEDAFYSTVQKVALSNMQLDFFEEFKNKIINTPSIERERVNRLSKLENSRVDSTHPPTYYRKEFANKVNLIGAKYIISEEDSKRIKLEISKMNSKIQQKIVDSYRYNICSRTYLVLE